MQKFDFNLVENFDNHIKNSILGYNLLYNMILNLCSFFINKNSKVIDIGCTTGKLIKEINEIYKCDVIGYDITDKHFDSNHFLKKQDITENNFIFPDSNMILSLFTIQFLDYKHREKIIEKIFNSLEIKGIFIICEKENIQSSFFQEVFNFMNYDYKKSNFTNDQILEKENQLRTVMKLNNNYENYNLLKKVGFKDIEIFFQSLQFRGYICRK